MALYSASFWTRLVRLRSPVHLLAVQLALVEFVCGDRMSHIKDIVFNDMVIGDREVTCAPRPVTSQNDVFPAATWSCYDLRVDGHRLQYWHMDGLCSEDSHLATSNDYGALCRRLMHVNRIHRPLWAAMISNASCQRSAEARVLYTMSERTNHVWHDYAPGRGYVITLQCMTDPEPKP